MLPCETHSTLIKTSCSKVTCFPPAVSWLPISVCRLYVRSSSRCLDRKGLQRAYHSPLNLASNDRSQTSTRDRAPADARLEFAAYVIELGNLCWSQLQGECSSFVENTVLTPKRTEALSLNFFLSSPTKAKAGSSARSTPSLSARSRRHPNGAGSIFGATLNLPLRRNLVCSSCVHVVNLDGP